MQALDSQQNCNKCNMIGIYAWDDRTLTLYGQLL